MRTRYILFSQAVALLFGHALAQNSYSCPANNNQVVTDATTGEPYIIRCYVDTSPGFGPAVVGGANFNDCFNQCSIRADCAAFTHTTGGPCYLKGTQIGGYASFNGGPSNNLVSAIKMAHYPPTPPSFTCPQEQDRTVVRDPNTGVQYVLWCNYNTIGEAQWNAGVADSFNGCFYLCSTSRDPRYGNCTGFSFQGPQNGLGSGICYMKVVTPLYFVAAPAGGEGQYIVAAARLDAYDGRNGAPFFYATTLATVFPPAATQIVTRIDYFTSTLLAAFPVTALSTLTRLTTFTSSLTFTFTRISTLPDATRQITSLQIVPTTIVTIQIATITITTVTTQQIVTVVPTTIIQTLASTLALLNTRSSIRTTVLVPVVTMTPVQQFQQTVTIAAA